MSRHRDRWLWLGLRALARGALCVSGLGVAALEFEALAGESSAATHFHREIQPVLTKYCYDCHGDGMHKGNVAFDELGSDKALVDNHELWNKVLRNVRAGLMPPAKKPRPDAVERGRLENWVKFETFGIDPRNVDPGRVTVRRLNRVEYRNTIHDLLGVDFDAENQFPPDDTGYGFDDIGSVLTLSPMLLEKYLAAATTIVAEAKPTISKVMQEVPQEPAAKRARAAEFLAKFAGRAFRRPVEPDTAERLAGLAEQAWRQPGATFEAGIARAMVAVLSSPRFLFREEKLEPGGRGKGFPRVDEFSLASRLSYFLWSSMPDAELFSLAAAGQLRKNLDAQVKRMLADRRSQALVRNFTGQWLQARDVEGIPIEARSVLLREEKVDPERDRKRARFRALRDKPEDARTPEEKEELAGLRAEFVKRINAPLRVDFNGRLRRAMRQETEKYFDYVVREDRPLLELIESDYTFLNERLAKHYGLPDVAGDDLRLVKLPPDSPRGGVLTQGTVLAVTSNPTRTSPVKRGRFVLDAILGTPPPPPPPNIPPLEDAAKKVEGREPTLRETLELHRTQPMCNSCHNRMDPLGLAFENFNAMGMWRNQEREQTIDASGTLITGEPFTNVRELKHILATRHARDFYRCLTEKMLTYAIGRGLDYYDVETVDEIVERIDKANGAFSALLGGVIDSAPFQKSRPTDLLAQSAPGK
jgi:hypothetical protein